MRKMKFLRNAPVQPPRLSASAVPSELLALENDSEYTEKLFADCALRGQSADNLAFDQVLFQRASLTRSRLLRTKISDTKLEASDLSETILQKGRWNRVECVGCRLTGFQLLDYVCQDVLFKECSMEGVMFRMGRFRSVRFEKCNLRRSLFDTMDLAGTLFLGCDLTGADLLGSTLEGVDFRGSGLADLHVEGRQLQGTTIDPLQAIQVALLLGVTIKEIGD